MRLKVTRNRILAAAVVALLAGAVGSTPLHANCDNGVNISWTGNSFVNCGPAAEGFFWAHHLAVQRVASASVGVKTNNNAAGVDSGTSLPNAGSSSAGNVLTPNGPGSYLPLFDWSNPGPDGCIGNLDVREADGNNCITGGADSFPVQDFMISGPSAANPNIAVAAVASVDFLECFSLYEYGQAGMAPVDGDPCFGGDCFGTAGTDISCQPIPRPAFANLGTCTAAGCQFTLTTPLSAQPVPIATDCQVAFTRTANCTGPANDPRGLDGGYQLMFRRDVCAPVPTFNTHILTPFTATGGTATNVWTRFSSEDANLNGLLDAGEDGTHGGQANGALDPVIFPRLTTGSQSVFVPALAGATDCLYFSLALRADPNAILFNAIQHEPVLSAFVTVNTNPVHLNNATPASDRVLDLVASKTSGKASVSWNTSLELTVAGFNVIGTKKNGGEVQLNSSLIPAKKGTTGEGASYSASFNAGDLKGSTAVFVEVVKTSGAKERFGPASF